MPEDSPLPAERQLARAGRAAWSLIGIGVVLYAIVFGLAVISTVVIPLMFAAVFAVVLHPAARALERRGVPRAIGAGLLVAAIVVLVVGIIGITVSGVIDQSDQLAEEIEEGLKRLDVDAPSIDEIRQKYNDLDPSIRSGAMRTVSSGLSTASQVVIGVFLGMLLLYYLLKDGPKLRRSLLAKVPHRRRELADVFIGDACYVLRRYWLGRTIISAIVATVVGIAAAILGLPLVPTLIVVTFFGGFIPYIGALVGGALAVLLALAGSGVGVAVAMLVVVLVANLVIENAVEPIVTGRTLEIHPLVVLLGTSIGGLIGGIVGMVMTVPIAVVIIRTVPRLLADGQRPQAPSLAVQDQVPEAENSADAPEPTPAPNPSPREEGDGPPLSDGSE